MIITYKLQIDKIFSWCRSERKCVPVQCVTLFWFIRLYFIIRVNNRHAAILSYRGFERHDVLSLALIVECLLEQDFSGVDALGHLYLLDTELLTRLTRLKINKIIISILSYQCWTQSFVRSHLQVSNTFDPMIK